MLDEERREAQQPEDSFYRRAEKTLLTCSLFLGISVCACCLAIATSLSCFETLSFLRGQKRTGKHIL